MTRYFAVVTGLLLIAGCAPVACPSGMGSPMTLFTLYFGKSIPGRGDLTQAEWRQFQEASVSVNLPHGYTVWDGFGAWLNPKTGKTVTQGTKILATALPAGPAGLMAIDQVRADYQARFQQQLVGMTSLPVCAEF